MNKRTAEELQTLRRLHGRQRLRHIWAYYKLPILIFLLVAYAAGYAAYRQATRKEPALYLALVNLSPGDTLTRQLTEGFAREEGLTQKQEVYLYGDLLLTESEGADPQYVYASELRLTAAVSAERLDIVLMNAEARDAFAAQGYLAELSGPDPAWSGRWLDVSDAPFIAQAGFPERVYLGVLANAPHRERAAAYIRYLLQE